MRHCLQYGLWLLVGALILPRLAGAQSSAATPDRKGPAASTPASHDLSGMWEFFLRGVPGQGIYATPSKEHPPMTAWARARYDAAKPGYGPKAQAAGNDPILRCDPSGIPRILFFPQPFEIVQTPQRIFMFFEREHAYREIWMDGRQHPQDLDPTWMGDSIGHWDGDTLVVDTVGFNDKSWLDFYGDPHSDQMHLIERYRRVDEHTLALNFTVTDPKAYTQPWASDTKLYKLLPKKEAVMEELFCVPEEEESFTERIRDPAAGVKGTTK